MERDKRVDVSRAEPPSSRLEWENASSGTYVDRFAPRFAMTVFLLLAFVFACTPSVGMLWARTDTTSENRELASPPQLTTQDGDFNVGVLADAGTYFEDHFAYRNELVSAQSSIRAIFATSPTDQVVVGRDGWLYYGGTLPDYLGQSELSDRALRNIAHNLSLVQHYAKAHGARFVFTIAPNKNTLYPEHMPYYYLKSEQAGNASRLRPYLEDAHVAYADLFALFEGQVGTSGEECLYLKRDTHWNNLGALIAAKLLLKSLGRNLSAPFGEDGVRREDFTGDLESILFPSGARSETNWYFEGYNDSEGMTGELWSFVQGSDVTDAQLETKSSDDEAIESLVMFRDSFGNALISFLAPQFAHATFSKLVPYNIALLASIDADAVIIERAERHLSDLAENAPLMPNPIVAAKTLPASIDEADSRGDATTLSVSKNGPYIMLKGVVDPRVVDEGCRVIIEVAHDDGQRRLYDAFWLSSDDGEDGKSDYGYQVNLLAKGDSAERQLADSSIKVYVASGSTSICAREFVGEELAIASSAAI